jgi:hypothetical protein
MAILARLQFGDNASRRYTREYLVGDFKCHVARRHNEARPDGKPKCDSLELTVVVPGKEDLNLYEWYIDRSCMSGRVLVELPATGPNQPSQWKEVLFEDGLCYGLSEAYDIDRRMRRMLRLSVVATEISIDGIVFKSR